MKIIDVEQGSPEWLAYRAGRVTASVLGDMMAKTKSGWGASRANLQARLVAERLTGQPQETYTNAAMQWGIETEPQARQVYELLNDVEVRQVGLVEHSTIALSSCSPDGLVGDDGMLEVKCPNTATHIETLLSETIPQKYVLQMQWQMECCGRAWCDFASFDPRMPGEMQLYVQRVRRDDALIADLRNHVNLFLDEIADTVSRLRAKYAQQEAA